MSRIPDGITRDDVLSALEQLGRDGWARENDSRVYDVIDPRDGLRYPPKLAISTAAWLRTGQLLSHHDFTGGPETRDRLGALGFAVVRKAMR